ncbi:DUF2769 domain-containing protein [Methanosalsum natronophilum]|uniref:DUF2769 domain-containing protein n=1 Tax=Methanosalsum natronophilum TaxID=768733 RepID=UPI002168D5FF|nr:DUF2769 domain-containing protein [Methanosalsum natronophilum]MCS3924934.1 hypothetical protein [Methanosalsum natronophilum]
MEDIKSQRDIHGRYYGICASYHHAKGCLCVECASYPDDGRLMYCAKGPSEIKKELVECMCVQCEIHSKFKLEGQYFCQIKKQI